ncbi:MAG: MBL fold metallo-hydrolase, partial [Christensenellaceae bacterium]|nr:MBL fold metallo-hydrolase [Christensenellaceae bacterium]
MAEVIKLNRNVMAVNTYIVYNEETKKGVVIDPSFNPQVVIDCINEEDIEIEAILLTHGHFDHIAGVDAVRKQFGVPVYIHADDADMLFSAEKNHSSMAGARIETDPAEHTFKSGD